MQEKPSGYGIYLAYIDDYLRQLGEDTTPLFRSVNIDPASIQQGQRVSVDTLADVFGKVFRQKRQQGFFLALGTRIPMMAHGNLGSAFLACRNVRTLLQVFQRYACIVLPSVLVNIEETDTTAELDVQISSQHPDFNASLCEALIATIIHNLSLLTGKQIKPLQVSVAHRPPSYVKRYRQYMFCEVSFNAPSNRIVFAKSVLDLPIITANEFNQRRMLQQCDDELKRIQEHLQLHERIREIVSLHLEKSPSIGFVAEKLHISERTLRRRLKDEGVNFRELLKSIRHEMALYYLAQTEVRIEKIASQLGYGETACFRHAFKAQTGQSPREWREAARKQRLH